MENKNEIQILIDKNIIKENDIEILKNNDIELEKILLLSKEFLLSDFLIKKRLENAKDIYNYTSELMLS